MRAALVVLLSLAALGCGSEEQGECEIAHVDCPNEPASTVADRCRAVGSRGCAEEDRALFRCVRDHQVCDGRGRIDLTASEARCSKESAAFAACVGADATSDAPADLGRDAGEESSVDDATTDATDDAESDVEPG
ncbi:MAG: hypothetical protein HYV09_02560 [Deltaproteobacteria bacterium]|nr:hypothetical protein [Deltaproteobacteria bacterium]